MIITNVTMMVISNTTEDIDICSGSDYTYPDGYSSTNITVNESHVSTLTGAAGCDSIITTNLNVLSSLSSTENINACENSTVTYPDGATEVITSNTSHISTLVSSAGCDSVITTNVTMDPLPNAGTNGSISFCSNDPNADLFNELGGTPDNGGTWSPALSSGTGVFDPSVDSGGNYTYQVTNACGTETATVNVVLNPAQDASFTYSSNSYCSNDLNPTAVISGTSGGSFSIDNGGIIDASTGEINISGSGAGNYVITYTTPGPCSDISTLSVSISEQADASITQVGPFCDYDGSVLLQGADAGGTWSGPGVDPVTRWPLRRHTKHRY